MIRHPKTLSATILVACLSLLTPSMAQAVEGDEDPTQKRIDEVIAEYGGEQTAWNEVEWNDGEIVFTAAPVNEAQLIQRSVSAAATRNCDSGRHCAFSGTGYSGERLAFSSCSSNQSLGVLSAVRSIANNRSGKRIKVYKKSTLLTTVGANSGSNVSLGATSLTCS
ncbi:hypothetical protein GCM10027416_21170 [Okibacterium endophyticum]